MKPWLLNILACPIEKHHPLEAYFYKWETSEEELEKINSEAGKSDQSFLKQYSKSPFAISAQYWIGECYNAVGDYREAINAFNLVLNYQTSYKFDDALIMNGVTYLKIGEVELAKKNFQQLVQNYPDSEYAPKAMRYLGRL